MQREQGKAGERRPAQGDGQGVDGERDESHAADGQQLDTGRDADRRGVARDVGPPGGREVGEAVQGAAARHDPEVGLAVAVAHQQVEQERDQAPERDGGAGHREPPGASLPRGDEDDREQRGEEPAAGQEESSQADGGRRRREGGEDGKPQGPRGRSVSPRCPRRRGDRHRRHRPFRRGGATRPARCPAGRRRHAPAGPAIPTRAAGAPAHRRRHRQPPGGVLPGRPTSRCRGGRPPPPSCRGAAGPAGGSPRGPASRGPRPAGRRHHRGAGWSSRPAARCCPTSSPPRGRRAARPRSRHPARRSRDPRRRRAPRCRSAAGRSSRGAPGARRSRRPPRPPTRRTSPGPRRRGPGAGVEQHRAAALPGLLLAPDHQLAEPGGGAPVHPAQVVALAVLAGAGVVLAGAGDRPRPALPAARPLAGEGDDRAAPAPGG